MMNVKEMLVDTYKSHFSIGRTALKSDSTYKDSYIDFKPFDNSNPNLEKLLKNSSVTFGYDKNDSIPLYSDDYKEKHIEVKMDNKELANTLMKANYNLGYTKPNYGTNYRQSYRSKSLIRNNVPYSTYKRFKDPPKDHIDLRMCNEPLKQFETPIKPRYKYK